MSDLTTLPDQWTDSEPRQHAMTGRSELRAIAALALCVLLVAAGAYVIAHIGLEGLRPQSPKDLYYTT